MGKWLILGLLFLPVLCFADSGDQQVKGTVAISSIPDSITGKQIALFEATAATTTATIIEAEGGKTLKIYGIHFFNTSDTAGNVTFYWEDGTTEIYLGYAAAKTAFGFDGNCIYIQGLSKGLKVTTVPTGCRIVVWYIKE